MRSPLPPLFVVGCPRSGTTFLAELLGFTRWSTPVETHFITKYYRKLPRYGSLEDRASCLALLRAILAERPILQWKLDLTPEALLERVEERRYASIVDAVCGLRAGREGKDGWADKTPHYVLELPILDELFPDARFVHIVRDGRDVALSLLEKPWGPNNVYACARYWKECVRATDARHRLEKQGRLLEVRYEHLLDHPAESVSALFGFFGQPVPSGVDAWIAGLKRGNHDKWRKAMRPSDVRLFEEVAGDELRRLGYETTAPVRAVPLLRRAYYTTDDTLRWAWSMLQQNLVDGVRIRYFGKEPFAE